MACRARVRRFPAIRYRPRTGAMRARIFRSTRVGGKAKQARSCRRNCGRISFGGPPRAGPAPRSGGRVALRRSHRARYAALRVVSGQQLGQTRGRCRTQVIEQGARPQIPGVAPLEPRRTLPRGRVPLESPGPSALPGSGCTMPGSSISMELYMRPSPSSGRWPLSWHYLAGLRSRRSGHFAANTKSCVRWPRPAISIPFRPSCSGPQRNWVGLWPRSSP